MTICNINTISMRQVLPGVVQMVVPNYGHYSAAAELDKRAEEPSCIVGAVLQVLSKGLIKPGCDVFS